ncbi:MAG: hypothetical protein QOF56_1315 [Acidobacteriaceae bacterium]|nr:hypothetical protein [Acidobacteriaceae bacterium]
MDLPALSPEDAEFGWTARDWLWTEAATAAIADRESPHDANALALSPTVKSPATESDCRSRQALTRDPC